MGNLSELEVPGCVQWNFINVPCIIGVMVFKRVIRGLDTLKQKSCHLGCFGSSFLFPGSIEKWK